MSKEGKNLNSLASQFDLMRLKIIINHVNSEARALHRAGVLELFLGSRPSHVRTKRTDRNAKNRTQSRLNSHQNPITKKITKMHSNLQVADLDQQADHGFHYRAIKTVLVDREN